MEPAAPVVTQALVEFERGDVDAPRNLLPLVYDELRRLAQSKLRNEPCDPTMQATALVHEAYLKLVDQTRVHWRGRTHFFAVAAEAMRRLLVDHARARGAQKRGGGRRVEMPEEVGTNPPAGRDDDVWVAEVLGEFELAHPRQAKVAQMRFFGAMNVEDVAAELDISAKTVKNDWRFARAWLEMRLASGRDTLQQRRDS